jgi:hypothetical protein
MRSLSGDIGLATLRLGAMDGELQCGDATLTPRIPNWMRLPEMQT